MFNDWKNDPLAAMFLVLVLALSAVLVVFAARTMTAAAQGWFNLLIASLIVVILARNITLFLVGWEMMAVTSLGRMSMSIPLITCCLP